MTYNVFSGTLNPTQSIKQEYLALEYLVGILCRGKGTHVVLRTVGTGC